MNPQFFGDRHDLFKYDLITCIMKELRNDLSSFTFVPMLTKNRRPTKKSIAGNDNPELWNCFNEFCGDGAAEDYFKALHDYFAFKGIKLKIFDNRVFSQKNRREYFDSVRADLPKNSLIFFDPDTGLKDKNISEKHLAYSELRDFFSILDERSILMIYQHFYRFRNKHKNFPLAIVEQMREKTGMKPEYIDDNSIMFLFLVKNPGLQEKLHRALDLYKEKYKESFMKG